MKELRYLKYLLISVVIIFAACGDDGTDPVEPPEKPPVENPDGITLAPKEMRSVWITSAWGLDWPDGSYDVATQKQKYINYLEKFKELNINTVIMQIRPMADAFYNSSLEPWSSAISGTPGKDPGYDVLQFMIDETHKRDMEFHAWMNPYRIASRANESASFVYASNHIVRTHPEWTMVYANLLLYNPARPEVQDYLVKIVDDVITKYDVDGIHFDDYFYPEPVAGKNLNDDADYKAYGTGYSTIQDFRRGNVNKVIKDISELIVKKKPGALFTISPAANYDHNYNNLYADVTLWCKEGWIDIVMPQLYMSTGGAFTTYVGWWPQFSYKATPMIGYALYKFGDTSASTDPLYQTTKELENEFQQANRQSKIKGSAIYRAKSVMDNKIGITNTLAKIYENPAVIPFIGRKTVADPTPASNISISSNKLTWEVGNNLRTVIYKIENKKGKVIDITSKKEFTLTEKGDYALTTINKDNAESTLSDIVTYK